MPQDTLIDPTWSVHRMLEAHPETEAVFARFGIHTCCGGGADIASAAERDGVDREALVAALQEALQATPRA